MAIEKSLYQAPQGIDPTMDVEPMALEIEIEDPESVEFSVDGETIMEIESADEGDFIPHAANLAEILPEEYLDLLSSELLDAVSTDLQSRAEWEETYYDGLELLGLKIEERSEPWDG